MLHGNRAILAIAATAALALGVAACGSSSSSNSSSDPAGANAGTGAATVTTQSVAGTGEVLTDAQGVALYTNNMDKGSNIACTGQCLTEWIPLAAPASGGPTSDNSAVQAKLGTVKRPDGRTQVTFGGMPVYSFAEDSSGQVTGDGFTDAFGGTHFVWTAARSGGSSGSGSTTTTQSSGGYGGMSY